MPMLFMNLISNNMATLHEIETVYSYEDCLNMNECLTVKRYNEWVVSQKKGK